MKKEMPGELRHLPLFSSVMFLKLRILHCNWFSKHGNVIMCNLFCKLFLGYRIDYKLSTVRHNFSYSFPAYFSDFLTVYTLQGSFVLLQTNRYFVFPMLEQKPSANAVSPTVLQSDAIRSLMISVTSNPPMPSKLR